VVVTGRAARRAAPIGWPQFSHLPYRPAASDRAGAHRALPQAVMEELVVWGSPEECGRRLGEIEKQTGIHPIATLVLPKGADAQYSMQTMAASASSASS
jgi:hypothetical protein